MPLLLEGCAGNVLLKPKTALIEDLRSQCILTARQWKYPCSAGSDLLQAGAEAEQALPVSLDAHGP